MGHDVISYFLRVEKSFVKKNITATRHVLYLFIKKKIDLQTESKIIYPHMTSAAVEFCYYESQVAANI